MSEAKQDELCRDERLERIADKWSTLQQQLGCSDISHFCGNAPTKVKERLGNLLMAYMSDSEDIGWEGYDLDALNAVETMLWDLTEMLKADKEL